MKITGFHQVIAQLRHILKALYQITHRVEAQMFNDYLFVVFVETSALAPLCSDWFRCSICVIQHSVATGALGCKVCSPWACIHKHKLLQTSLWSDYVLHLFD